VARLRQPWRSAEMAAGTSRYVSALPHGLPFKPVQRSITTRLQPMLIELNMPSSDTFNVLAFVPGSGSCQNSVWHFLRRRGL
jgi:hypothetical protein